MLRLRSAEMKDTLFEPLFTTTGSLLYCFFEQNSSSISAMFITGY